MATENLVMPKTCTPASVYFLLVVMAVLTWGLFYWLLGFFGTILTFVLFASTTGVYTKTVPGYTAWIILNNWTGYQRTLFQGLNFTLPWESFTKDVDLKVDLKDVNKESYAAADGSMDVKYIYTIRPDTTGDNPGAKIIRFASYEPDAIKMAGRACFSMSLSDYYSDKPTESLLSKAAINKAVFEDDPVAVQRVKDFEDKHGVKCTVQLEDSDRNAATQAAIDSESKAKSLAKAAKILSEQGWNEALAQKTVRQLNLPNVEEYIISLDAKGLENLHDFTVLGGLGKGGKK